MNGTHRHQPRLSFLWLFACLVGAGLCTFKGLGGHFSQLEPTATASVIPKGSNNAATESIIKPIQLIQVGERVLAQNPERDLFGTHPSQIVPDEWRKIALSMRKADGSRLDIVLLRSLDWLNNTNTKEGATIDLNLPELGATGLAEVLAVEPCPLIQHSAGSIVTGTFAHSSANIIDIEVDSSPSPIGCTDIHPFWSEDNNAFIPAGKLRIGEKLRTISGTLCEVTAITKRDSRAPVFNLEVDAEHVYFVSTAGVLVHNSYIDGSFFGKTPGQILRHKPKEWLKTSADRGHGWKLIDENGIERVRFMYPSQSGRFVHERTGYFRRMDAQGNFLDVAGDIVSPDHPLFNQLTHIVLSGIR